jgi:hypothetical protein
MAFPLFLSLIPSLLSILDEGLARMPSAKDALDAGFSTDRVDRISVVARTTFGRENKIKSGESQR